MGADLGGALKEQLDAFVAVCRERVVQDEAAAHAEKVAMREQASKAWYAMYLETARRLPEALQLTAHVPEWAQSAVEAGQGPEDNAYIEVDIEGKPTLRVYWKPMQRYYNGSYDVTETAPWYGVNWTPRIVETWGDGEQHLGYDHSVSFWREEDLYKAVAEAWKSAQDEPVEKGPVIEAQVEQGEIARLLDWCNADDFGDLPMQIARVQAQALLLVAQQVQRVGDLLEEGAWR